MTLPPHPCLRPGCPALVPHGYCPDHAPRVAEVDGRESSARRGYGRTWRKVRRVYLSEHPLCEDHLARGQYVPATEVDHVIALAKGGADDATNYRALCHSCHSIKTAREDGGGWRRCAD